MCCLCVRTGRQYNTPTSAQESLSIIHDHKLNRNLPSGRPRGDTMSNWRVELTANSDNQKAIIDVMDTVGPLNKWRCVTDDAFIPDEGEFTNQGRRVVPLIPNFWQLDDFDIDEVQVGSTGSGEVFESGSSFPNGPVSWRVVKAL